MNKVAALVVLLAMFGAGLAKACDVSPGEGTKPSWEELIGEANLVFVGRAVDILPEVLFGERVLFQVERPVKGRMGEQVEVMQGVGECSVRFNVGDRVIFAGTSMWLEIGVIAFAEVSGWDATVFLAEPPTPEQAAQLDHLTQITDSRYRGTQ